MLEVNLVGPFVIAREAARAMKHTGGGSIVNISSTHALRALPVTPCAGYTAAKAGLAGLTRELATQWARYSIRVTPSPPARSRPRSRAAHSRRARSPTGSSSASRSAASGSR